MKPPEMISLTLQDRIFPSEDERLFLDTYLADVQRFKRILFSQLYGRLRANLSFSPESQRRRELGFARSHVFYLSDGFCGSA